MNEFTKEELRIIACYLCINSKTVNILIKLESMIDNYCEHEWINGTYCEKCERTPTECIERGEMG